MRAYKSAPFNDRILAFFDFNACFAHPQSQPNPFRNPLGQFPDDEELKFTFGRELFCLSVGRFVRHSNPQLLFRVLLTVENGRCRLSASLKVLIT